MRSYKHLIAKSLLIASIILGALGTTASPVKAATVNNALPVTDTTATSTDSSTSQTTQAGDPAYSNVSVDILSGILTLEQVPDFAFGSTMLGSTVKLQSNVVDTTDMSSSTPVGEDGNSNGVLKMIDSRTAQNNDGTGPGFSLSASMTKLNPYVAGDKSLDAILHLSSLPLIDQNKENIVFKSSDADLKTNAGDLDSATASDPTLINLQSGTYRAGVIQALFNTSDSATLEIPNQDNDNTSGTVKKYNAVITWTLNAAPVVNP
ncbi:WxL domain-containing protein [Companilactobacillus jidongensis]|uniref:WxL domain-containing protein n=1 Tax=Companilactobacillus jidongensis TaxID=2486006 RepID=UPI000F787505|nr:WxL domain-containing protein [Companilactobacillus jidongensis]